MIIRSRRELVAAASIFAVAALAALCCQPRPSVPLVDLRAPASVQREAWAAGAALGAVRLVGHGLDIAAALNASRSLFALPEPTKLAAGSLDGRPGFQRGYLAIGGESGLAANLELKEGFCYGYEWPANAPVENGLCGPNLWPEGSEGAPWRAELTHYFHAAAGAMQRATAQMAEALLLPVDAASLLRGGERISIMRLFHYFSAAEHAHIAPGGLRACGSHLTRRGHVPPTPVGKPRTGSSAHTDWHVATLIAQDGTGGLQLLGADGAWVGVPPLAGEVVVLLGDYLHLLSRGATHSPIHRVLLPPERRHRYSLTLFGYPSFDATLPAEAAAAAELPPSHTRAQLAAAGAFNTLVNGSDPQARLRLAEEAFGDLVLDKWRGVAANRVGSRSYRAGSDAV